MMKRNECNDTDPGQSVGYFFFAIDFFPRSFALAEECRRAGDRSTKRYGRSGLTGSALFTVQVCLRMRVQVLLAHTILSGVFSNRAAEMSCNVRDG